MLILQALAREGARVVTDGMRHWGASECPECVAYRDALSKKCNAGTSSRRQVSFDLTTDNYFDDLWTIPVSPCLRTTFGEINPRCPVWLLMNRHNRPCDLRAIPPSRSLAKTNFAHNWHTTALAIRICAGFEECY